MKCEFGYLFILTAVGNLGATKEHMGQVCDWCSGSHLVAESEWWCE